jgi:hypothetical protein
MGKVYFPQKKYEISDTLFFLNFFKTKIQKHIYASLIWYVCEMI